MQAAQAVRYGTHTEHPLVARLDIGDSICSGVRVHRDFILTVGHCFKKGIKRFNLSYRDGNLNIKAKKNTSQVIFKGRGLSEELALIPIQSRNDEFQAPEFLSLDQIAAEDIYQIYGYGMNFAGRLGTQRKGEVYFQQILSHKNHKMLVVKPGPIQQLACPGDSGGPLFKQINGSEKLIGVVSFINHSQRQLGSHAGKLKACQQANQAFYIIISEHQAFLQQHLN
jgi:hypothetical protein